MTINFQIQPSRLKPAIINLKKLTLSLAVLLIGCGSEDVSNEAVVQYSLPQGAFTSIEGLPSAQGMRLDHKNSFNQGIQTANNGLIILGDSYSESSQDSAGFLLQLDEQLNIEKQSNSQLGYAGICQHDSGEFTLAKIVEVDEEIASNHLGIMLQRYSGDHILLTQTLLRDELLEEYYNIVFDENLWLDVPFTVLSNEEIFSEIVFPTLDSHRFNPVTLHCSGENLLVAFNHFGKKIAWYNQQLEQQWSDTLMLDNYVASRGDAAKAPKVFINKDGTILASTDIINLDIPAINHRFDSRLPNFYDYHSVSSNILLKQWTSEGQLISTKMLGTNFYDFVAGVAMIDDTIWITAKSYIEKMNQDEQIFQWDISVFQLNANHLDETVIATPVAIIDVDQQDRLEGMKLYKDQLWLYGINGFQQSDLVTYTNYPKGFYGYLDLNELVLKDVTSLQGPRATMIQGIIHSEDSVITLGTTDGPIDHGADQSSQGFINQKILDLF